MENIVEINNCKHYLINQNGSNQLFFYDTLYLVERDYNINHPFGEVYRPKYVIDTPIRFVRQLNNSVFVFKETDWNVKTNPFAFNQLPDEFYFIKKILKLIMQWLKEFKTV